MEAIPPVEAAPEPVHRSSYLPVFASLDDPEEPTFPSVNDPEKPLFPTVDQQLALGE